MLCQQCQAREATVHFSVVAWPSGDETNHLCESCYAKAEAERTASYNLEKPIPVVEFERMPVSVIWVDPDGIRVVVPIKK
jgi:protein-arginine kinase activator protein McsA